MTTQYTPTLKLALPVTGELSGTWGDVVNDNITSMIEQAIAGLATINTWTANSHTLTTANGTTSESRCAMLVAATGGGAPSAAAEIVCPAAAKLYVLQNNTSYAVTLKTSGGSGVAVAAGDTAFLFCDGTNVNSCVTTIVNGHITGNLTVDGNATINGNTTLGNATSDTVTVTARVASNVLPSADNTYDLGSTGNSWKDLYIDGTATMALVAISGGTINGVSIGATTPATFLAVDNLSLDGNTIASTNTNGNIVIAPNGTGDVQLDADTVRVGDSGAAATLTSNGAGALTVTTGGAADLTLSTNSGTTSGTITIANGANGNITLTPNGTGDVILSADTAQIGDANTDATLTTNGTGNLNLTTNNGTNSGTIQIAQGANGNITLTPNGTGSVSISKAYVSGNTTLGASTANTLAVTALVNSNLLFTDATYDIGATGANRPRDMFLSRNLTVGGTLTLAGGVNLNGNVTIGDSSADTLTVNSTITSNLIFTDNTYDIGASGANRPRTLNLSSSILIGGAASGTSTIQDTQAGINATSLTTTTIKNLGARLGFTGVTNSDGYIFGGIAMGGNGEELAGIAAYDNGSAAATGLKFFTGTTGGIVEAATVDSTGNWMFNTTTAIGKLTVENANIAVGSGSNTNQTNVLLAGYGYRSGSTTYGNVSVRSTYSNSNNSATLEFYTATSGTSTAEVARFDSSGRFLVNTASALYTNSKIQATASSGPTLGIQQTTNTEYVAGFWNNSSSAARKLLAFYYGAGGSQLASFEATGTTLLLYGAGSNGISINSSGYVGVATVTPTFSTSFTATNSALLQVGNETYAHGQLRVGGNTSSAIGLTLNYDNGSATTSVIRAEYGSTSASAALYIDSGFVAFRTGTSFTERMRINSGGSVALGSTGFGPLLNLYGTNTSVGTTVGSSNTGMLLLVSSEPNTANYGPEIVFANTYSSPSTIVSASIAGTKTSAAGSGSDQYNGNLIFKTSSYPAGLAEKMRINYDGNVGINNNSPSYKLDVTGPGTSNGITMQLSDGASGANSRHIFLNRGGSTAIIGIAGSQANDPLWISRSSGYDLMVTSAGNVGIGTSTPGGLLAISKSQNDDTTAYVENGNSGASAAARFDLRDTASHYLSMRTYGQSATGTTIGVTNAKTSFIWDNSTAAQSGGLAIGTAPATPLMFSTNATERMRIDSSGNVAIGSTSSSNKLLVNAGDVDAVQITYNGQRVGLYTTQNNASYYNIFRSSNSTGSWYDYSITTGSSPDLRIYNSNSVGVQLGWGSTSWASYSDERLKDIIEPITNAVAKVRQLRTVIGKFKTDTENVRRAFLIAQDVQKVLPEAVSENQNENENGIRELMLRYTEVIPLLAAAINELSETFEAYVASHP